MLASSFLNPFKTNGGVLGGTTFMIDANPQQLLRTPMASAQVTQWLDQVDPPLFATRYIALAAFICTVWDHALTLDQEVEFIWKRARWNFSAILFLLNRYGNEATLFSLAFFSNTFSDVLDEPKVFLVANCVFMVLAIAVGNVTMTLRLYSLWDGRRSAMVALWLGFGVTYAGVLISFVFTAQEIYEWSFEALDGHTRCLLTRRPLAFIGVWASMLVFDIFTIIVAISSALERPYRRTAEVMHRLQQDGIVILVTLAVLRLINMILAIVLDPFDLFTMAVLVWAMVSIAMSRITLRMESVANENPNPRGVILDSRGPTEVHVVRIQESQYSGPLFYWTR